MRDAREDPPVLHIVAPDGRILDVKVAKGISHPLLDPKGCLRIDKRDAGYRTLQEMYESLDHKGKAIGPEGGWEVYLQFAAAVRAGKHARLPDQWLPPEVLRRRKEAPKVNEWTAPPPPEANDAA